MKISKTKLRQIIMEELQTALQESGPMAAKRAWREGSQKIRAMGLALNDTQIEDLAQNDRATLGVYDALLQTIHPGVMTQDIRTAYEDPAFGATRSWEDYQDYVRNTLIPPPV